MTFDMRRLFVRRAGAASPEIALGAMVPLTGGVAYANVGAP
jgi:hypothetical protein